MEEIFLDTWIWIDDFAVEQKSTTAINIINSKQIVCESNRETKIIGGDKNYTQ